MSRNSPNGGTRRWVKLRAAKLEANPVCEWPACNARAVEVDHRRQLRDWPAGRYVWDNLRSLCDHHHDVRHGSRKTRVDPATGLPLASERHHWWHT
jgi:hypothetical protein